MKEIATELLEVGKILEQAKDQDSHRIQEFNSTFFWMMEVAQLGLTEAVVKFTKEVTEVINNEQS